MHIRSSVQNVFTFLKIFHIPKKAIPDKRPLIDKENELWWGFLYINKYKIILFFKPRPKKPTHNTNAVHVHTETVKLADFAILLTAQFLRSNITVCFGDNHLWRIYIHTPAQLPLVLSFYS